MKKILIVDDSAFMQKVIQQIVEELGHQVVGTAATGKKAIALYKIHKPDAVTMDITLPDISGIEAVRSIRAYDQRAQILICSAMGQKPMVIDAIDAGAVGFIVKPFNKEKVKEALKQVFNQKEDTSII